MARKKKQLPILEKVTITDVAAEGKAIARVNDMVVFVPFVAPGDVVDIQLTRKKNSYAEGKPVYFHEYSAKRAEPFCEHFGVCGGCKWQHLPYEEQLYYKQKQVYDNLTRIGKVEMEEKLPILGSERTTFYRNKLEFTFSNKKWLTEEEIQSGASFDCMNGVIYRGCSIRYWTSINVGCKMIYRTRSVFASRNIAYLMRDILSSIYGTKRDSFVR